MGDGVHSAAVVMALSVAAESITAAPSAALIAATAVLGRANIAVRADPNAVAEAFLNS